MARRNDADPVTDVAVLNRFFPHIMPRRCDAMVFFDVDLDVTEALQYVRSKKKSARENDVTVRLFNVILAALARTMAERPRLNRFIANYQYWQRRELSFNFIVKQDMTDEAPERNVIVKFLPGMTFDDISEVMDRAIKAAWYDDVSKDEAAVKFLLRLPKFLIRLAMKGLGWMDRHGLVPASLRDTDGVHVSAFVANLGSIDIANPPHHHLYEWGTTSVFMTIGKVHRTKILDENDQERIQDTLQLSFTVDERIAEGFYFIKSMKLLRSFVENPSLLDEPLVFADPHIRR
jgi:hypothetical protein